jgi:lysophospholipase L1-like esterase
MKLFSYGDSWTEGQGVNPEKENAIDNREKRKKFRNENAWPKILSDLLECEHVNQSLSGSNNNLIFNTIISDIKSGVIKSGDLMIVMWSSSLRDDVPFFPKDEWHTWGNNYLKKEYQFQWFVSAALTNNANYNDFLVSFKEFFIGELYTQDYYNMVNQNYILFIQKLCEFYKINYVFCDAFDKMIDNIKPENDKTYNINKSIYWGFGEQTFKEFLINTTNPLVWEEPNIDIFKTPGMHPSRIGYNIIAEELYAFISNNDIIRYKESSKKIKII